MDIERFSKNWLESRSQELSSELIVRLGTDSLAQMRELVKVSPDAPRAYAGNNLYTIAAATYDAGSGSALVAVVGVRFSPTTGAPEITDHMFWRFDPTDRGEVINLGLFDYVTDHVLREGRAFAAEFISYRPGNRLVKEISSDEAVSALSNLMDAANRTTRIIAPPGGAGIGGPTDLVLLGAAKTPKRIHWKSS